ncbi:phospholipase D-like domain-containing protein [Streptomyces sp. NPDC094149]|uniref:phospholipase D-like domain-containing protein n=1 Tax=Streptomyces sp. NPDC094149 TaxID=3155079 RepID=UPI003331EF2B
MRSPGASERLQLFHTQNFDRRGKDARASWGDDQDGYAAGYFGHVECVGTGAWSACSRRNRASGEPRDPCGSPAQEVDPGLGAFAALPGRVHIWHRTVAPGVLHAKLIAADRHTALLGGANLTDRELSDNVDLGVMLRDPSLLEPSSSTSTG